MEEKKGYWTRHTHLFEDDDYECSVCSGHFSRGYDTCPSCGAEMKSTEYDPSWVDEMADFDEMFGE